MKTVYQSAMSVVNNI